MEELCKAVCFLALKWEKEDISYRGLKISQSLKTWPLKIMKFSEHRLLYFSTCVRAGVPVSGRERKLFEECWVFQTRRGVSRSGKWVAWFLDDPRVWKQLWARFLPYHGGWAWQTTVDVCDTWFGSLCTLNDPIHTEPTLGMQALVSPSKVHSSSGALDSTSMYFFLVVSQVDCVLSIFTCHSGY